MLLIHLWINHFILYTYFVSKPWFSSFTTLSKVIFKRKYYTKLQSLAWNDWSFSAIKQIWHIVKILCRRSNVYFVILHCDIEIFEADIDFANLSSKLMHSHA